MKLQHFRHYILPWLILAAICYGLFLIAENAIQIIYILSTPIVRYMP